MGEGVAQKHLKRKAKLKAKHLSQSSHKSFCSFSRTVCSTVQNLQGTYKPMPTSNKMSLNSVVGNQSPSGTPDTNTLQQNLASSVPWHHSLTQTLSLQLLEKCQAYYFSSENYAFFIMAQTCRKSITYCLMFFHISNI